MYRTDNQTKSQDFKDVQLRPRRTTLRSRSRVDLTRTIKFRHSGKSFTGVPIIATNMETTGTFEMAIEFAKHQALVAIHQYYSIERWKEFADQQPHCLPYVAVSCGGASDHDYEKMCKILNVCKELKTISIEVGNGYSQHFVDYIRKVRRHFPFHTIIAGNVFNTDIVEELVLNGADVVKIGIGPGSIAEEHRSRTRTSTGIGYSQVTCVVECADAAHGLGAHVIADVVFTSPGDVAKAFAAGADFVMLRSKFAGHDQCSGALVVKENGERVKLFHRATSSTSHRETENNVTTTSEVPYRGDVTYTLIDVIEGLRSTCASVGVAKLEDLPECTTFVPIT